MDPRIASDARHEDEVALLATCRTRPADDMPRLALADWLEDRGQTDRANFIRIQCELAHPSADSARTRELARIAALLESSHPEWIGILPDRAPVVFAERDPITQRPRQLPTSWLLQHRFVRGMLELKALYQISSLFEAPEVLAWLRSPQAEWIDRFHVDFFSIDGFVRFNFPAELAGKLALNIGHPRQQASYNPHGQVQLTGSEVTFSRSDWRRLVKSPNFQLLRSLVVQVDGGLNLIRELAAVNLDKLVALRLPCGSDADEAARIIAVTEIPNLSSLALGPLTPPGIQALCRSQFLSSLYELDLTGARIADAGAISLAESPLAQSLGLVGLQNKDIGDLGLTAVIRSPLMKRLAGPRLNLMMNRIGSDGLAELARSEELLRFRELVLRENQVGNAGVEALAQSPYVANLEYLDFWRNQVSNAGAVALSQSPHLNKIVDLSLKENQLGPRGREELALRFGDKAKC